MGKSVSKASGPSLRASLLVETASGDTPVKTPGMGKSGLNISRTSGGGLSL
ncbi:TPA: hypothetical protein ACM46I_001275 [Escherichia coli]